ncbi:hypothetical protein COB55_06010 [Candidatus Wolfebacteria bacterium]|nr:MAG: hypothetical protein COB55_06010 [Candidatus Wolfebacteria bacterium]
MDTKKLIQELNVIFKQRGWELLPEDNNFKDSDWWDGSIIQVDTLYIDRNYIPYGKCRHDFTYSELDNYVMEYIKPICKKYGINGVIVGLCPGAGINYINI